MIKKMVLLIGIAVMMAGCAGTNTVRVSSIPDGAKLYANGEYVGETPKSVPSKHWMWFGIAGGDTVKLRLEKSGYKLTEKTVPFFELKHRFWQGDFTGGSEFGWGNTFTYTIHLEKE